MATATEIEKEAELEIEVPAEMAEKLEPLIRNAVQDGKKLVIPGVGYFTCRDLKARNGRNPRTGDKLEAPAARKPTFKFYKKFGSSFTLPDGSSSATAPAAPLAAAPTAPSTPPTAPSTPPTAPSAPPGPPPAPRVWYIQDTASAQGFSGVPENELLSRGLTAGTMVWSAETDWVEASKIPALASLLSATK